MKFDSPSSRFLRCTHMQASAAELQLFVCVGILVAFAIGRPYDGKEAFVGMAGSQTPWWRVMLAIGLVPAALQVCSVQVYESHLCVPSC